MLRGSSVTEQFFFTMNAESWAKDLGAPVLSFRPSPLPLPFNFQFLKQSIMAKIMSSINDSIKGFIEQQHLFFVGTAARDGRVNVSPKGMDTLRVVDKNRVIWMNLTGSGNETAAHLLDINRMTLMFCSFEEMPLILRLYGTAKTIHQREEEWSALQQLFPAYKGARQIFDMAVETVQTSCGYAVPFYDFKASRNRLVEWSENKGEEDITAYWKEKNSTSIDGFETGILF